jgi:uncharacterized membrane protein
MQHLHRVVSASVVALVNLASIAVGFVAYSLIEGSSQLLVQIPVGYASGLLGVVGWLVLLRRWHHLVPDTDYMIVFLLSFPLAAIFLTCVHYLVTGYLTSFGNIGGAWAMQFAVNVVALPIAATILNRIEGSRSTELTAGSVTAPGRR